MISDEQINRWANPPSTTESEKCTAAIDQITKSVRDHFGQEVTFVRQGSHYNHTNVRLDSDVDIAVVHSASYFPETHFMTESDKMQYEKISSPAKYTYEMFKTELYNLLNAKFGRGLTKRKNKCIRLEGNANRVSADVVPVFPYRRFSSIGVVSEEGIALIPDNQASIIHSYPKQHYDNGVEKNRKTGRAFKSVVRVLKNIRNDFHDKGMLTGDMPSFFIECLVWNVQDEYFNGATYRDDVLSVSYKIWKDMHDSQIADRYAEICDLRWLFKGSPHHSHDRAKDFSLQVLSYVGKS